MNISDSLWNFIAPVYRSIRNNPISGYILKLERQSLKSLLEQCLSSQITTICDLGLGRGHSMDLLPQSYPVTIALDKNLNMIRFTRDSYPDIHFLMADVHHLPFKKSTFDLILCIGVTEYIPKLEPLLQNAYSNMKAGGFLLLTISPQKFLTRLRFISGHRIYARDSSLVKELISDFNFKIMSEKSTPLQIQYLLKK